jgi:hypothetical protein
MLVAVHLVARDAVDEAVEGQSHIPARTRDNAFGSADARRVSSCHGLWVVKYAGRRTHQHLNLVFGIWEFGNFDMQFVSLLGSEILRDWLPPG